MGHSPGEKPGVSGKLRHECPVCGQEVDTKWDSVLGESSKIQASKLQGNVNIQGPKVAEKRRERMTSGSGTQTIYVLSSKKVILRPSLGLEKLSRRVGAEA